jgi:integrase
MGPRMKLGRSTVETAKPKAKPYELHDDSLEGFILRVQPTGVKTFYCVFGRGKRIRIGRADALSTHEAREQARLYLSQAYRGEDPLVARHKKKADTYRDFLDVHYAPWARAHHRSAQSQLKLVPVLFGEFLDRRLDAITALDVEKWRTARLASGRKPSTVNRNISFFKASISKAVEWGLLAEHPLKGVKQSRVDDVAKVRFLSQDEEGRLRAALSGREAKLREARASANAWRRERRYPLLPEMAEDKFADHLKPMVLLSLNTGMRRCEVFGLTWENVNLISGLVTVTGQTAKSKRTRHIPLNAEALHMLRIWRTQIPQDLALVFPAGQDKRFDNVKKSWAGLLRDASIIAFRWHDMRHHFASRLAMAGVDLNTIRELLGHSDYTMTLRYAHLAPEHRHRAVELLIPPKTIMHITENEHLGAV